MIETTVNYNTQDEEAISDALARRGGVRVWVDRDELMSLILRYGDERMTQGSSRVDEGSGRRAQALIEAIRAQLGIEG